MPSTTRLVAGALIALFLLADATPANAQADPAVAVGEDDRQSPAELREGKLSDNPISKKLDEKTEFSLIDTDLRDGLSSILHLHGINMFVDEAGIQADKVSLDQSVNLELSGLKLRSALKFLLEPTGLGYVIEDEVLRITSRKAAENHREMRIYQLNDEWQNRDEGRRLENLVKDTAGGLWKEPGANGAGGTIQWTPAGLAVRQDQRSHLFVEKLLSQLDQRAILSERRQNQLDVKRAQALSEEAGQRVPGAIHSVNHETKEANINLGSADHIQRGMRLKIFSQKPNESDQLRGVIEITRVRDDHFSEAKIIDENTDQPIEIGDPAEAVKERLPHPEVDVRHLRPAEQRIVQALASSIQISFVDTSLLDALDTLENMYKFSIAIDQKVLTQEQVDNFLVSLEAEDAELQSALNLMLEPHDLDYLVKDEVLLITTQEAAARHLELRIYPLGGLWEGRIDQESKDYWETLVQDAVGGKWKSDDGKVEGGTVHLTPAGLVVRHNQRTHREIVELLNQLRKASE